MMIVFPDTHLFLHFRDLRELPWDKAISDDAVALVVGRTVQKELEKKKYELRGRPQDRARTYARKLAEIVNAGSPLIVREKYPRVTLDFVSRPTGWAPPDDLDPSWQDDQIVADVLAFMLSHADESVVILTGDAGLTATSRSHNIQVIKPDSSWEMPSEASSEEKEIRKLQHEISQFQKKGPAIGIELMRAGTEPIQQIELPFDWYPAVSDTDLSVLLGEIRCRHPISGEFDRLPNGEIASPQSFELPNETAIEAYRSEYSQWIKEITSFMRRVARGSNRAEVRSTFELRLRNTGVEPANRMRFALEVNNCLLLWPDRLPDEEDVAAAPPEESIKDEVLTAQPFRRPPCAPTPRRIRPPLQDIGSLHSYTRIDAGALANIARQEKFLRRIGKVMPEDASSLLRSMDAFGLGLNQARAVASPVFDLPTIASLRPEPRDPHAFYWRTKSTDRAGASKWEFECEEYAHLGDDEVFAFALSSQLTEGKTHNATLHVRASATNLRQPINATFKVKLVCNQADTIARLRSLLPL